MRRNASWTRRRAEDAPEKLLRRSRPIIITTILTPTSSCRKRRFNSLETMTTKRPKSRKRRPSRERRGRRNTTKCAFARISRNSLRRIRSRVPTRPITFPLKRRNASRSRWGLFAPFAASSRNTRVRFAALNIARFDVKRRISKRVALNGCREHLK